VRNERLHELSTDDIPESMREAGFGRLAVLAVDYRAAPGSAFASDGVSIA
jgi:hypothetical protein